MTITDTPTTEYFAELPIGRVLPDPLNPRKNIQVDDAFRESIAAGIIEPLIVRPDPAKPQLVDTAGPCDFLLVAGERRYTAALEVQLETVPAIVRYDLEDNAAALECMLTENGQRADLAPLEEAAAYAKLVELGRSQRDIAKRVGREQGTVSKRLSLLKLPERAQALLRDRTISVQTALGMTALIKDNGALSQVLDYASRGADDHDIAAMTFRQLDDLKRIKERAGRAKKIDKQIADLRAGALVEMVENDLDGDWEECDETDATAYVINDWGGQKEIEYYRPATDEPGNANAPQATPGPTKEELAAERERRDLAKVARRSLIENLCRDGYPGEDEALVYAALLLTADFITMADVDDLAELAGVELAEDDPRELDVALLDQAYNHTAHTAFAAALLLGENATYDDSLRRLHVRLLMKHGYEPLPEERALLGDTIPDGNYPSTLEGADNPGPGALPPYVEGDNEIHDAAGTGEPMEAIEVPLGEVGELVVLAEPWKGYQGFPVKSICNIIAKRTTIEELQAVIDYEQANGGRGQILDAAKSQLATITAGATS